VIKLSYVLPLTAEEIKNRLLKVADLTIHEARQDGTKIVVSVDYAIENGSELKFRSPADCNAVTRLVVNYKDGRGESLSKTFAFSDANGNNIGEVDNLFAEGAIVKVILDLSPDMDGDGMHSAFVQNADTNAYLERRMRDIDIMTRKDLSEIDKAQIRANIGALGGTASIRDNVLYVELATVKDNVLIIK
jgi:hypothetical protein